MIAAASTKHILFMLKFISGQLTASNIPNMKLNLLKSYGSLKHKIQIKKKNKLSINHRPKTYEKICSIPNKTECFPLAGVSVALLHWGEACGEAGVGTVVSVRTPPGVSVG